MRLSFSDDFRINRINHTTRARPRLLRLTLVKTFAPDRAIIVKCKSFETLAATFRSHIERTVHDK